MPSSQPVVLLGRDLSVLGANTAAQSLAGGADLAETLRDVIEATAEALRSDRLPLHQSITVATPEGPADLDVQVSEVGDLLVLIAHDAGERRAMRRAADRAQRAEEVAQRRLAELDHARDQFLDLTAHELRSPLAAIHGFASLLRNAGARVDVEELSDRILRRTDQLTLLVDRVVTFARLNARRIDVVPDRVDVRALVDDVADTFRPRLLDRTLVVDVTEGLQVDTDANLVEVVLRQLVDNAIVYTAGRVTITIEGRLDGDDVVLAVVDDGPGIDHLEQAQAFERFQRGANAVRLGVTGLGIGLSIVRAAVDLLHGEVSLLSDLGQGTRVEVRLPTATTTAAPSRG